MMDLSRFGFSTVEGASEIKELAIEFEDLRAADEDRIARYASYRAENEVARRTSANVIGRHFHTIA